MTATFVVPLIVREAAPGTAQRLNPVFPINGDDHVMATQFAGSVAVRELGEVVGSLKERAFEVVGALDVLIAGV